MNKTVIGAIVAVVLVVVVVVILTRGAGPLAPRVQAEQVVALPDAMPAGGYTPAQVLQMKVNGLTKALQRRGLTAEQRKAIESQLDQAKKDLQAQAQK